MSGHLYPIEPLAALCRLQHDAPAHRSGQRAADCWSDHALAQALDVTVRTVQRWRRRGLTDTAADRAAIRLGLHPALVWPEWWATAVTEVPA